MLASSAKFRPLVLTFIQRCVRRRRQSFVPGPRSALRAARGQALEPGIRGKPMCGGLWLHRPLVPALDYPSLVNLQAAHRRANERNLQPMEFGALQQVAEHMLAFGSTSSLQIRQD
jgi:hypothetical protein